MFELAGHSERFVSLRCCECRECSVFNINNFETVNDKYAIIKDGQDLKCHHCGSPHNAEVEKYIPKETEAPVKLPRCPTCQSVDIEKISGTSKFLSFAAVGVFSSNFGKTFRCRKCGYKW